MRRRQTLKMLLPIREDAGAHPAEGDVAGSRVTVLFRDDYFTISINLPKLSTTSYLTFSGA